jgi:hypothetical protein
MMSSGFLVAFELVPACQLPSGVGAVVVAPVGLKVGAELGRSSTKRFPSVLSLEVTFTVIEEWELPSESMLHWQ